MLLSTAVIESLADNFGNGVTRRVPAYSTGAVQVKKELYYSNERLAKEGSA